MKPQPPVTRTVPKGTASNDSDMMICLEFFQRCEVRMIKSDNSSMLEFGQAGNLVELGAGSFVWLVDLC